jgi:CheY-like chemotaxis protein
VLGDATQIHQVVMNLCANAVQAMRSSGVLELTVQAVELDAPLVVSTSTLPAGPYVRLAVSDTGTGMAPQVLERIFDPFFTTKEVGVGTGLGLSLVHGIVTDLSGGIDVRSHPGAGSSFTVWLPRHGSVEAPVAALASVPEGDGQTVMLVDDEDALVRLGEEMMAALGYEPVGFVSGAAALASFRATPERYSAVLTDESMPDITGFELARAIRAIRPDIPIILMSGYVTSALAARARDIGVTEVLAKPLVSADIARGLAHALRR